MLRNPSHHLSQNEIGGSIKGDVNKKVSPSAGSREAFCLDIEPTVCRCTARSLEGFSTGLLFGSLGFISRGDNVRRFLKLGKRFDSVATMLLSEKFLCVEIVRELMLHGDRDNIL
jgi:hypothetical protein